MKFFPFVKSYLTDFIQIIYPSLCECCNSILVKGEEEICIKCLVGLPKTESHIIPIQDLNARFWGRVKINKCIAYLNFNKGGSVQKLLYKIKYKNGIQLAYKLGLWYGYEIKSSIAGIDMVVPVPLHKSKLKKRGYNQSEWFARGLSSALEITYLDALERTGNHSSQTRKSREERWRNVKDDFEVLIDIIKPGTRILLVDDVITTGATIEACAQKLLMKGAEEVSVAAISYAT